MGVSGIHWPQFIWCAPTILRLLKCDDGQWTGTAFFIWELRVQGGMKKTSLQHDYKTARQE
jgi:hypothetical protein